MGAIGSHHQFGRDGLTIFKEQQAPAGPLCRLLALAGVSNWILLAPSIASSSASWITRFSTMWPRLA
ncbi:hypothetical protein ACSZOF_11530 [Aeromonas veronii]